jgi:hypothetical protein
LEILRIIVAITIFVVQWRHIPSIAKAARVTPIHVLTAEMFRHHLGDYPVHADIVDGEDEGPEDEEAADFVGALDCYAEEVGSDEGKHETAEEED